jgi:2-hydroxychromene-2-carboxylate isomerase
LLDIAKSDAIAAQYAANRDWAISTGVFGAPSFVVDGEIFWGQDRLELLASMLESGRTGYKADPTA